MTKQGPSKRKGRPTAAQSREIHERILNVALELFLDKGYDAVTMDDIAKLANVTKRALYLRHKDKNHLFADAFRESRDYWSFADVAINTSKNASLEEKLISLANALMDQALDERVIKLARIATTHVNHLPEDLRNNYDIQLSPRVRSVISTLKQHEEQLSNHTRCNYSLVAEIFIGMIVGIPARLASFDIYREPEFERKRIRAAVTLFLQGITNQK